MYHLVCNWWVLDVVGGDGKLGLLGRGGWEGGQLRGLCIQQHLIDCNCSDRVGSKEDSHLDDAFTGQLRRHLPLVCGDVLVSSVVAKQVHNVQVVPLRRPVQSCPSVNVVLGIGVHSPGKKEGFEL